MTRSSRGHAWRPTVDISARAISVMRCPWCGKLCYRNREDAKRAARQQIRLGRLRVYNCGEFWHLTRQTGEESAEHRRRRDAG